MPTYLMLKLGRYPPKKIQSSYLKKLHQYCSGHCKGCVFNCDVLPCEVKDKAFTPSIKYIYFAYSYIFSVRSRVSFEGFVMRIEHTFSFCLLHREVMGTFSVQWLPNPNSLPPPTPLLPETYASGLVRSVCSQQKNVHVAIKSKKKI